MQTFFQYGPIYALNQVDDNVYTITIEQNEGTFRLKTKNAIRIGDIMISLLWVRDSERY